MGDSFKRILRFKPVLNSKLSSKNVVEKCLVQKKYREVQQCQPLKYGQKLPYSRQNNEEKTNKDQQKRQAIKITSVTRALQITKLVYGFTNPLT
jgi:hypothetical protein